MWLASSHLVQGRDAVRSQQQNATPFAFMKRGESIYGLRNSWLSRKTLLRLVGFKPFCIVSFHFVIDELTLVPRCLVNQSMRAKTFCLKQDVKLRCYVNPLNPELNPICYLLAFLAHHFLHVSRIRVKSLTIKLLMSYIYGAPILDVSRSHTTTQHSR